MDIIYNYIKQFGLTQFIIRFFFKLISPVLSVKSNLVLTIINQKHKENITEVQLISVNKIKLWLMNGQILKEEFNKFNKFIADNCIGYYLEINNELAAWGFVQAERDSTNMVQYIYELPDRSAYA